VAALGLPQPRLRSGLVVSGDSFIRARAEADRLRGDLPDALAVDMESAAVAQVSAAAAVPCAIARLISDRADGQAGVDFARFLELAAPWLRDIVVELLATMTNDGEKRGRDR